MLQISIFHEMLLIELVAFNHRKSIFNRKNLYSFTKYAIWFIAIVSMTVLTYHDVTKLIWQYKDSKTVANIVLKDKSKDGIHLPNQTICIYFNNNFTNQKDFSYNGSNRIISLILAISQQKYADYLTTNLWTNYTERQHQWNEIVKINVTERTKNIEKMENELAKELCHLLDVKLVTYIPGNYAHDLHICDLAESGAIPFSINSADLICFRAPLDLITLKGDKMHSYQNNSLSKYYSGSTDKSSSQNQVIRLSFNPLIIRTIIKKPHRVDDKLIILTFFPEIPTSYRTPIFDDLKLQASKSQFIHELTSGASSKDDLYYFGPINVFVEFLVHSKYNRINDKQCVDVYNKTNCIIECLEKNFSQICNCNRFIFWHFTNKQYKSICSREDYVKCAAEDRKSPYWKNESAYVHKDVEQCEMECSACSMMEFIAKIYSTGSWGENESPVAQYICYIFKELYDDNNFSKCISRIQHIQTTLDPIEELEKIHKDICKLRNYTDTDAFIESFHSYANYFKDTIHLPNKTVDNFYKLHKEFCTSTNFFDTREISNGFFARISYLFSMKLFKYQEVTEMWPISDEAFIAQIGGICGMYLGVSGLTFFLITINFMKYIKNWRQKRHKRRIKETQKITLSLFQYLISIWKKNAKVEIDNAKTKLIVIDVTEF